MYKRQIHAHPGRQEDAFLAIQDVVHYVARTKPGFLWSNLAKSTDGKTVVNIEAISGAGKVDEFFSDQMCIRDSRTLAECKRESGGACEVFFSDCSMPVRVQ